MEAEDEVIGVGLRMKAEKWKRRWLPWSHMDDTITDIPMCNKIIDLTNLMRPTITAKTEKTRKGTSQRGKNHHGLFPLKNQSCPDQSIHDFPFGEAEMIPGLSLSSISNSSTPLSVWNSLTTQIKTRP